MAERSKSTPSKFLALMHLTMFPTASEAHHEVLDALSAGIRSANQSLSALHGRHDESAIEEGVQYAKNIEVFLGIAFVALQTRITSIFEEAITVQSMIRKTTKNKQSDYFKLSRKLRNKGMRQIDALWAIANYVKHRDQWRDPWAKLPAWKGGDTAGMMLKLGLQEHDESENLTIAAKALGLKAPYSDLHRLENIVDTWAYRIHKRLKARAKKMKAKKPRRHAPK